MPRYIAGPAGTESTIWSSCTISIILARALLDDLFLAFARLGQRDVGEVDSLLFELFAAVDVGVGDFLGEFPSLGLVGAEHLDPDEVGAAFLIGVEHSLELGARFIEVREFPALDEAEFFDRPD